MTGNALGWKDMSDVGQHVDGKGAAHPEVCEDHLLTHCEAIGGNPLAQDWVNSGKMEVVSVTLPQEVN